MKTKYQELCETLDACATVAHLQRWATALYESGLLDESEQTTMIGQRGPLAPWSVPESAVVIDDHNGEDITIRLASGEIAKWTNRDREWCAID